MIQFFLLLKEKTQKKALQMLNRYTARPSLSP
jgi:hypothetical protein